MKIGLYFGSFNPVHIGHGLIGRYAHEIFNLDQVDYIVSPHNPLKNSKTLISFEHRVKMVELMCQDMSKDIFKINLIEKELPLPSYTADTLRFIKNKKEKGVKYYLIMGSDSFASIKSWKDYQYIVDNFPILLYPRVGTVKVYPRFNYLKVKVEDFEAPLIDISSTIIRNRIKKQQSLKYMVPDVVNDYININKLYETKK